MSTLDRCFADLCYLGLMSRDIKKLLSSNIYVTDLKGMHILSFTVDLVIDQDIASRRDGELASSAFEVVRKHTIVALKPNIKIWLIFTYCCQLSNLKTLGSVFFGRFVLLCLGKESHLLN